MIEINDIEDVPNRLVGIFLRSGSGFRQCTSPRSGFSDPLKFGFLRPGTPGAVLVNCVRQKRNILVRKLVWLKNRKIWILRFCPELIASFRRITNLFGTSSYILAFSK